MRTRPNPTSTPQTLDTAPQASVDEVLERGIAEREPLVANELSILDALPANVALVDSEGRIVAVNASWRRFAVANGMQSAALGVGENYLSVCDQAQGRCADDADRVAAGIRQILSGTRTHFSLEYPCHAPREQRWYRMAATPLRVGNSAGAIVVHVDVTERVLSQEALRRSEREQRDLARTLERERATLALAQSVAHVGSWETDMTSFEVTWSAETYRIFGTDPAAFQPSHQAFLSLVYEGDRAAVDQALMESMNTLSAGCIEHRIVMPDGSIRVVEERWQPISEGNNLSMRAIGTCHDITERKRAEEALLALSAELEQRVETRTAQLELAVRDANTANQAKSSFLATMSHEIRTPMNGVIGMLEVLHQAALSEEQLEMVNLIRESAFSLLTVIEDILDFSKIESGKLELEIVPFQLGEIVARVCHLSDAMAMKQGVDLTYFVDPALPRTVLGDGTRVRQVVVNLVNNAIKFSSGLDRRGRVSVRVVPMKPDAQHLWVAIQVRDNGIGMTSDTVSRLFNSFSQADVSTTRRFGGTGLGLAIARRLAELMGGSISVQSEPERGSTFEVRLPFTPVADPLNVMTPDPQTQGLRCVVVGDARSLAGDISAYLTAAGALVSPVPDMAQASMELAVLSADAPICIVALDVAEQDSTRTAQDLYRNDIWPVRSVVVAPGSRRQLRVEANQLVRLDCNVMHAKVLLKAVAMAAGRVPAETVDRSKNPAGVAARIPGLPAPRRHRILVAEDNDINQKVILRQLKLLGYEADVAASGTQALDLLHRGHYALLLTDLRMPELDGFGLAAAIRADEPPGQRLPIVALTANALKSEAQRCIAAGMDDYLTKPTPLAKLRLALKTLLVTGSGAGVADLQRELAAAQTDPSAPVDTRILANFVDNDVQELETLLADFRKSAQQSASRLRVAFGKAQMGEVAALAHQLKSSARWVGALPLGDLCAAIEEAGYVGDAGPLEELLEKVYIELARVDRYLEKRKD